MIALIIQAAFNFPENALHTPHYVESWHSEQKGKLWAFLQSEAILKRIDVKNSEQEAHQLMDTLRKKTGISTAAVYSELS